MPQPDDAIDAQPVFEDAPTDPLVDMSDEQVRTPHVNEPQADMDDTHDFYREVDESLEVEWEGEDLTGSDGDHLMTPLVDVLQTLGVSAADATMYAVQVLRISPNDLVSLESSINLLSLNCMGMGRWSTHHMVAGETSTLMVFMQWTCELSNHAEEHWDFSKASDRKLAWSMVEEFNTTWVVGVPHALSLVHGTKGSTFARWTRIGPRLCGNKR